MMDNKIYDSILQQINKDEDISPCLFLGKNMELLNAQIIECAQKILQVYNIPNTYIYRLQDNGEKIKIAEIQQFLEPSHSLPGYRLQIFIIENVSRFTLQSSNSCLKIFEEPGKHNLFFLTNKSESGILDTILSRVQVFQKNDLVQDVENPFFQSLLGEISQNNNSQALNYFYKSKLEKDEYIEFLKNIILFAKKHFVFIEYIETIEEDILAIQQNNVNAKYIVDKYILTL